MSKIKRGISAGKLFSRIKTSGEKTALRSTPEAVSPLSDGPTRRSLQSISASRPAAPPELARRKLNAASHLRLGRTIGEKREPAETASERLAMHRRLKLIRHSRTFAAFLGFVLVAALFIFVGTFFFGTREEVSTASATIVVPFSPTIPVVDEATGTTFGPGSSSNSSSSGRSATARLTSRMSEYIGEAEQDFRELGLVPVKAVIPASGIREVDFYFEGYPGYVKTIIDRGTGVTAEDLSRLLRYLASQGITTWQYLDLRIDGRAYWK